MDEDKLLHIADIFPPMQPVALSLNIDLFLPLLFVLLSFVIFVFLRSRKQQFKRLSRQYRCKKIDSRYCAFQISYLISDSEAHKDNHLWQEYSKILRCACYSRNSLDSENMNQLLNETEQWL